MKILDKKNYITILLFSVLFFSSEGFAKDSKIQYSSENISNYFSGMVLAKKDENEKAFKHLKKVQLLKNTHSRYSIEFLRTLVLLEKFDQAFTFSKDVWREDELFFEADLLLGIDALLKNDYVTSEKHFKRLNTISRYNLFFEDFLGNVLLSWNRASQGSKEDSFNYLKKIPKPYVHLTKIQEAFLYCYFDSSKTKESFSELIDHKDYDFSRYNFFLVNYLLSKEKHIEAKKIIKDSSGKHKSNLLLKQTENFLLKKKDKKIKNYFSCKNSRDSIAVIFYIIANLYSSEKNYKMSNFYLKISYYLNNKFLPNKALLAENFYYQERNELSKKTYESLKSTGSVYSWYASKSIAAILLMDNGKKQSIKSLEKDFNLISSPTYEHYYELANFYKDNEYYKKSIKYYSLTLNKISKDHFLVPKILDRRGTSYERLGDWKSAEKDLIRSLELLPDQPHVLNYLAYSWVDMGINLDKGLEMLKKATQLRKDDGYIIDSLGWAYYAKQNYVEAEQFLQRAVELLPNDPIINDHYADALWMMNKNIQARYVWSYILKFDEIEPNLRESINKKLLFGVNKKL